MTGMLILVHREKWESEMWNFKVGYLCDVGIWSYQKEGVKLEEMPRYKHSHKTKTLRKNQQDATV